MFVFAADLHLDLNTWSGNKNIAGDSLASLQYLLDIAEEHSCPLVLGGDVFDTKLIHPKLAAKVQELVKQYPKARIYFVRGNHDNVDPSWCECLMQATCLNGVSAAMDDDVVTGLDFQLADEFEPALKKLYAGTNCLVCHQTFNCFNSYSGAIDTKLVTDTLGCSMVLAGDYHVSLRHLATDTCLFLSPGSTNRRTVAEGNPAAILVRSAKSHDYAKIELPHRRLAQVDIESTLEQAKTALEVQDTDNDLIKIDGVSTRRIEVIPKPMLVLRGNITKELRDAWQHSEVAEYAELLFSPVVRKPTSISDQMVIASTVTRGSKSYIAEVLDGYSLEPQVKTMASDFILGDSKQFLEAAAKKFEA